MPTDYEPPDHDPAEVWDAETDWLSPPTGQEALDWCWSEISQIVASVPDDRVAEDVLRSLRRRIATALLRGPLWRQVRP